MKHSITVLLGLSVALFLFYSCQQEDRISPDQSKMIVNTYRVKQVVLDGIGVQDSLNFSYANGKVSSIDWCTHVSGNSECQNEYTEVRHFDDQGKLNEITGRWHVFYFFEN